MANDLTNYEQKLVSRGLLVLRKKLILPRLVNLDYSSEAAKKSDTINVPKATRKTATDVTAAVTAPTPSETTPDNVAVTLENHKHSDAKITDKEMMEVDVNAAFVPLELDSAMNALAEAINTQLWTNVKDFYSYVGTAGTTPFASNTDVIPDLRGQLAAEKCPKGQQRGVLNFAAEAAAQKRSEFRDASQAGKDSVVIEGELGKFFGVDWYSDDDVPTHTAGTITTGLIAKASTAQVVGDKTIVCTTAASTGACALVAGDIIVFAGHTQTYVVTAAATQASASTDVTVNIEPGLKVALAGSEAVSVKASHVLNTIFDRQAIVFVTRPLMSSMLDKRGGVVMETMTDPVTGIALRVELLRQYKQWVWDFDVLWGSKTLWREYGGRIAG